MPSTHGAVDLACRNGNTEHSSHSGENLVISEAEQTQNDGDGSQDEDSGPSDYETESDDSHSEVISKGDPAPERPLLLGKSTGINGVSADTDDTFRARLDLEFKKYREAKKRFLLSLIHDDKSSNCEDDENKLEKVYALFGDEIIILRDLNDNVDPKTRIGTNKEKKSKRDRNLRVKSRSRTNSRESTQEALGGNSRSRTQSENDQGAPALGRDPGLPANDVDDRNEQQEEQPLNKDEHDASDENSQFVERPTPEQEAERERRAKLRKMYRWERFRFGRFALDAKSVEHESTASPDLLDTKNEFNIPHKHVMTKQEQRETIGDSLFKDDSRKNVCYIDSKDAGIGQHILPIITASNYQQVLMSESSLGQRTSEASKEVVLPAGKDSTISDITNTPAGRGVVVEIKSDTEKVASEEEKKGKKDKKKKKRKDSSSSDDLEELERKSEARLGKRK